jgi:hypothetical protein
MGMNANDLMGCFDLSNPVTVVRNESKSGRSVVNLYPNPTVGKINITTASMDLDKVQVSLYDFGGNDITKKMKRTNEEGLSFNVQSIPSGIYLLRVYDGKSRVITKKVVIRQ